MSGKVRVFLTGLTLGVLVGDLVDLTTEIASRDLDLDLGRDWSVNATNVENNVAALDIGQFIVTQFLTNQIIGIPCIDHFVIAHSSCPFLIEILECFSLKVLNAIRIALR
jgi:hypothetical protein